MLETGHFGYKKRLFWPNLKNIHYLCDEMQRKRLFPNNRNIGGIVIFLGMNFYGAFLHKN
jgi:hypothetical protein